MTSQPESLPRVPCPVCGCPIYRQIVMHQRCEWTGFARMSAWWECCYCIPSFRLNRFHRCVSRQKQIDPQFILGCLDDDEDESDDEYVFRSNTSRPTPSVEDRIEALAANAESFVAGHLDSSALDWYGLNREQVTEWMDNPSNWKTMFGALALRMSPDFVNRELIRLAAAPSIRRTIRN